MLNSNVFRAEKQGFIAFLCLGTVLMFFACPLARSQNRPSSPPQIGIDNGAYTLRIDSKLVLLDVVVTDQNGNVVTNLKKEDFEILDDQQVQQIVDFEAPGHSAAGPTAAIRSTSELDRRAPQAPVNILVLDEVNTKFEDMAFARYALKKYLEQQPERLRQPTMLAAVTVDHFKVLQDYTQDKSAIVKALNQHFAEYSWNTQADTWTADNFAAVFSALLQVAEATGGHPGHKTMIWIGRGFPSIRVDTMLPNDAAELSALAKMCVNKLLDARITLYTVDPQAFSSMRETDADDFEVGDPFSSSIQFDTLASATGGKSFYGRNDVDAEIGDSIQSGSSFYTLAYRPDDQSDSDPEFHSIRVVMRNPNLHAATRQGYYVTAPTPQATDASVRQKNQMAFDLLSAADTTLIYDGIPVSVTQAADDPWNLTIKVSNAGLNWEQESASAGSTIKLQLLVASYDGSKKLIRRTVRAITIQDSNSHDESNHGPATIALHYQLSREVTPAWVRIVVRDPVSGKIGSANLEFAGK